MVQYTCDLSLNDYRYIDKIYGIFKIVKSKEKEGYDIIINPLLSPRNWFQKNFSVFV